MIKSKVQQLKTSETLISLDLQHIYHRHIVDGSLPPAFQHEQLRKIKQDLGYETQLPQHEQQTTILRDHNIHQGMIEESKKKQEEFLLMPNYESMYKKLNRQRKKTLQRANSNYNIGKENQLKDLLELEKTFPNLKKNTKPVDDGEIKKEGVGQREPFFTKWGTIDVSFHQILNIKSFGEFNLVSHHEELALKDYIYEKYPELSENKVQLKIAKL